MIVSFLEGCEYILYGGRRLSDLTMLWNHGQYRGRSSVIAPRKVERHATGETSE